VKNYLYVDMSILIIAFETWTLLIRVTLRPGAYAFTLFILIVLVKINDVLYDVV
jgi:hypothetical protein